MRMYFANAYTQFILSEDVTSHESWLFEDVACRAFSFR